MGRGTGSRTPFRRLKPAACSRLEANASRRAFGLVASLPRPQNIISHTSYRVHQNILLLLIPKIIFNPALAYPANSLRMVLLSNNTEIICCVKSDDKILFKEFAFLFIFCSKLCIRLPRISRKVSFLFCIKKLKNFFSENLSDPLFIPYVGKTI